MANNTIAVLRQMLASLDDAKKYQSLRDVMSTMNAPDLAAVFEDLPEEKMPVLFRLCPKDLAADVFAELSSETQEALIRGLTDREREICALIAARLTNREIGQKLYLSEGSVKQYSNQIYSKLHIEGDTRTKRKRLIDLLESDNF